MKDLKKEAKLIYEYALREVLPDSAVKKALRRKRFPEGKIILVAIGKAAFQMAKSAQEALPHIDEGVVITKYDHVLEELEGIECYEAGHPVLDENAIFATKRALELTSNLTEKDTVVFLVSGGGSALFEDPKISLKKLQDINKKLLASGASITEINTIRKRLSNVKAGRFAIHCAPANVFSIVLSDIVGDPLDMIASGPAYPDSSTMEDALKIIEKYKIHVSEEIFSYLIEETPKEIKNVETKVTGSVRALVASAKERARQLGYYPVVLNDCEVGEAKEVGKMLARKALEVTKYRHYPMALIGGGETIVHVTGKGKGGRNQELALAASKYIANQNIVVFSIGSDGTDGPTDAAGGIVDGTTRQKLTEKGLIIDEVLQNNDAYNALKEVDSLIITGPTGTNVNDLFVALVE